MTKKQLFNKPKLKDAYNLNADKIEQKQAVAVSAAQPDKTPAQNFRKININEIDKQLHGHSRRIARAFNNKPIDKLLQFSSTYILNDVAVITISITVIISLSALVYISLIYGYRTSGAELLVFLVIGWFISILINYLKKITG